MRKDSFGNQLRNDLPCAIIWIVWVSRIDIVFNDKQLNLVRICNQIKGVLWFWIGGEPKNPGNYNGAHW
ncbi:hypothetical protein FRX31_015974 [Thalictrum thalictroides]|uniref:Uncharacterized protein n=1 Tax=Thalictrum thalictroides TaxID=46969 RepID=A0A7J6WBX7_THATH|nr:hypothetical protein FRX31_015974 [Thalictrum thalictroides]